MAQSLAKVLLHVTFSTKNRQQLITPAIQPKLFAYLAGVCRANGSEAFRVGGTEDHVHIACTLPRTLTISRLLEEAKKSSSAWIKRQDPRLRDFPWQAGCGAFSLGQSQLGHLLRYIENQPVHHKKKSFKEELLEILRRYEVPFDERYLWD